MMLNNEERAAYARACMMEPLDALGIGGYDPARDFMTLVDRARGRAVAIQHWGFELTNAEIMEGLRVTHPAEYAMTTEFLVDKFIKAGLNR